MAKTKAKSTEEAVLEPTEAAVIEAGESKPVKGVARLEEEGDIAADYLGATAVECRAVENPGVDLRLAREADCQVFLATA